MKPGHDAGTARFASAPSLPAAATNILPRAFPAAAASAYGAHAAVRAAELEYVYPKEEIHDLRRVRVGRNAGYRSTRRPSHPRDDVRIPSATAAQRLAPAGRGRLEQRLLYRFRCRFWLISDPPRKCRATNCCTRARPSRIDRRRYSPQDPADCCPSHLRRRPPCRSESSRQGSLRQQSRTPEQSDRSVLDGSRECPCRRQPRGLQGFPWSPSRVTAP